MTFSIVAVDARTGELGVAVQSKFLAVGAVVPYARAGVGAVASQAFVDVTIGSRGLDLLERGVAPEDCVERLLQNDPLREQRQFGMVSADGRRVAFTGRECFDHASSLLGEGFAAQGNILAGRAVVEGLAAGFLARPDAPLAARLIDALEQAQQAGGDQRGQQSAALLVVKEGGGYGGNHDRMLDLRVDDHQEPIAELRRLHGLHDFLFQRADPASALTVDAGLQAELLTMLVQRGLDTGQGFEAALFAYFGHENLEERWLGPERIDAVVLDHLRSQAD
ncbi:DUF1028 domain-containing protein [Arthrobacter echini]|uniref:DUF1028 domain-containing protein n=1 Tax=Arthrobacter echini TaxID=1529066 RepID=A0A5D0XVB5_9MICC|nr:DUF1028 domain-containing protein [Arthrobacter echini]TYD00177.1 DUF1028 domain-containing protein [Arthrobacter echini]